MTGSVDDGSPDQQIDGSRPADRAAPGSRRSPTGPDAREPRRLRIVHLFPDLLSAYGDSGNVRTLVVRAERRAIVATVEHVLADAARIPDADLFIIGGGEDRDQLAVERAMGRLDAELTGRIADGAALLAVCGGYQNLGERYRLAGGRTVHGPAIFASRTSAGSTRLVGPVVATVAPSLSGHRATVIGFENHAGRTELDRRETALATIMVGHGNNGRDGTEGSLTGTAEPGAEQGGGLRIGTYLHGPLLPRNPHVADALLRAGLARTDQPADLDPIDDTEEWLAHDRFVAAMRHRSWIDRLPPRLRRLVQPARSLIGY
jgi:hypothetical protein